MSDPINNSKLAINESLTPMKNYKATVIVTTDSIDHAKEVFRERIGYDEDLGFDYTISCDDSRIEKYTPGITIDAPLIRDKLELIMGVIDKSNPKNQRLIDARDKMRSMDDGDLNNLITSMDDDRTFRLFQEVCDRILDSVIDKVNSSKSSS